MAAIWATESEYNAARPGYTPSSDRDFGSGRYYPYKVHTPAPMPRMVRMKAPKAAPRRPASAPRRRRPASTAEGVTGLALIVGFIVAMVAMSS